MELLKKLMYKSHILVFLFSALLQINLYGKNLEAFVNQTVEIRLESSVHYLHPIKDVELECKVTGPAGDTFTVAGFWDGNDSFKIRFALPIVGTWHYQIICNDMSNIGLNNINGTIKVKSYSGFNPFYRHGWLKVSKDGHYLTYADDAPFFYLADTAWEITWKSDSTAFLEYLNDRTKKGFSAIQIVAFTHQNFNFKANGIVNRAGQSFFIDNDFSRLNPGYFDYLDFIVQTLNDSGMVAVLVPLWATMMELYPTEYPYRLSIDESLLLAKYISSRYAGSNVIWIIGGDNVYDTKQRKDFWTKFANTIKRATGNRHLLTLHPAGSSASFDFFDNRTDWLDFHTYQSSHRAKADFTWTAGNKGYQLKPAKPVLNGEACYEDIFHNLWQPQDTTHVKTFRIRPEHVRQASYESILSGALVGITYGANGVWQWHTEQLPGTHTPRFTTEQAWNFPGSSHIGILKRIMIKYNWFNFKPGQELLVGYESEENYIPIASSATHIIAYIPQNTDWVFINATSLSDSIRYNLINPTNGDTTLPETNSSLLKMEPPDTSDWILSVSAFKSKPQNIPKSFRLNQNYPNPFHHGTIISYELNLESNTEVSIVNLLGQKVKTLFKGHQLPGKYLFLWKGDNSSGNEVSSGVYIARLSIESMILSKKMLFLR
jgi:hypothetical protein